MRKLIAFVLICGCVGGALVAWRVISFLSTPAQQIKKEVIFEVPTGSAFYRVANELEREGLVRDARMFSWVAKALGETTRLRVGEYKLSTDMKPRQVLAILTSGKSIKYSLTVPEGYNIFEIRDMLNRMWPQRGEEFLKLATSPEFAKKLTGENLASMEGYLFPETYILTKYTSMESLIRQMYDYFQVAIAQLGENVKNPMPLHQQVILASVIEKETGAPGERQLISSVFHNRLRKGMRLQSDPTIIYGIAVETMEVPRNIKKKDILRSTPYNTYTIKALPVGPISNPGKDALYAAVTPADSNYLYFVSRNDGTHVFSETYEEHNRAVKNFQLNRKMREGRSWRDLKTKRQ